MNNKGDLPQGVYCQNCGADVKVLKRGGNGLVCKNCKPELFGGCD